MPTLPARADYLNRHVTHAEYYGAILATAGLSRFPWNGRITADRVSAALANGDEWLNSIPLASWDRAAEGMKSALARALKAHGDGWSLSAGCCAAKELAKLSV